MEKVFFNISDIINKSVIITPKRYLAKRKLTKSLLLNNLLRFRILSDFILKQTGIM